jgi:hypothetical protein
MQIEGRVGVQTLQDGAQQPPRLGHAGEIVVDDAHGRFYEAVYRGNVFSASTAVAGVAPGTALAASAQAIILYNPAGNTKNYVLLRSAVGYVSGTLGAGSIVYGNAAQIVATGGTAVVPKNSLVGNAAASTATVTAAGTCTAVPTILRPAFTLGAFLATTAAVNPPLIDEIAGEFILTPGNIFVMSGVAVAGTSPLILASLTWEEVPV